MITFRGQVLIDYLGITHARGCDALTICGAEELVERDDPSELAQIWAQRTRGRVIPGTEPTSGTGAVTCAGCIGILRAALPYMPKRLAKGGKA